MEEVSYNHGQWYGTWASLTLALALAPCCLWDWCLVLFSQNRKLIGKLGLAFSSDCSVCVCYPLTVCPGVEGELVHAAFYHTINIKVKKCKWKGFVVTGACMCVYMCVRIHVCAHACASLCVHKETAYFKVLTEEGAGEVRLYLSVPEILIKIYYIQAYAF